MNSKIVKYGPDKTFINSIPSTYDMCGLCNYIQMYA